MKGTSFVACRRATPAILAFGLFCTAPAAAQETRADSLEARVGRLEAIVDSLVRVLGARPAATEDEPADELAAIRAAAAAAAADAAPEETADRASAQSRTGNLNVLNPEISITGDFVAGMLSPAEGANSGTAIPREFELSFQAALDPYAGTRIFFSREEELPIAGLDDVLGGGDGEEEGSVNVELEEGYLYWIGLPGALGLKAGKFRQELGLYNRWHTHALLEIDRPLATVAFLGDDGLIQSGLSLSLPHVQTGAGTHTVTLEGTAANNQLFEGGTNFSYLGRVQSFWDLGPSAYVQVGVNGVTGQNDDLDLDARLLAVDVAFRWTPRSASRFRELTLKGEWYWADRDIAGESLAGNGGYGQANYRWGPRWVTGFRADFLDAFGDAPTAMQLVPSVSWWQSEWVRLRLQYHYLKRSGFDADHTFLFQTVWAIGAHKHETY